MNKAWENFELSKENTQKLVTTVLAYTNLWESDLNDIKGLTETVSNQLHSILNDGIKKAMKTLS